MSDAPVQVHPAQGALFPLPKPPIVIDYARPDGGPLTDEDFDRLQEIARTASTLPVSGKVTIQCR
ncbi:hypothetical protein ACIGW7_39865 [Streptomyces sp. NPDC053253]|uniref:hypothetical protein n=1 Tax=Streptomyces sp. NPDC053253 TaxID=3365699 RepID=UPI0037D1E199